MVPRLRLFDVGVVDVSQGRVLFVKSFRVLL